MGFGLFPPQSPSCRISATIGPLWLSQTRVSYPSKRFPLQQPFCVTTVVAFSPLCAPAVSSWCSPDHKAFLHCKVRHRTTMLPSYCGPMLPWALFPFKVLPSILNADRKSPELFRRSGITLSNLHRSVGALDLLTPKCKRGTNDSCPSLRLYSFHCLPRQDVCREAPSPAGLPTLRPACP